MSVSFTNTSWANLNHMQDPTLGSSGIHSVMYMNDEKLHQIEDIYPWIIHYIFIQAWISV